MRSRIAHRQVLGQVASRPQLGLERLLGVLLDIQVDAELHVESGHRVDVLIGEFTHDRTRCVDLVDLLAPPAVQLAFHTLLNTKLPDTFVSLVPLGEVALQPTLADRAHEPHHMGRQRRIGIHALVLLGDVDARIVLTALHEEVDRGLVDVFLQWQGQQRIELLLFLTPRRLLVTRVVPAHQIVDRCLQRTRQPCEQLQPVARLAYDLPVDGDSEEAFVVGNDTPQRVEDATTLRSDIHRTGLGRGDLGLVIVGLHALQEPQAHSQQADEDQRNGGEDPEASGALVNGHFDSLVRAGARVGARVR